MSSSSILTDPIGPGEVLFTDHFYGHAKARAEIRAAFLVTQNGVPFMQPSELTGTMRAFKSLFADWGCYIANIPTYAGGAYGLRLGYGWRCPGRFRSRPWRARFAAAGITPDYYTPEVHKAAFALPAYIERLLPR